MSTSDGPVPPREDGARPPGADDRAAYRWLADRLAQLQENHVGLFRQVTEVASASSEILPRLDGVEFALERVAATLDTAEPDGQSNPKADDLTPATRWSQLDGDQLAAAWDALGRWVAEVLCGEYRVTRVQLPDCWPVHPRAKRELAWLRTLHVSTLSGPASPEAVAEWHTRWLPAALYNIATAIDPRECAPGRHRLTDAERHRYDQELIEGEGRLDGPVLTTERGVDRPRYFPDLMPARRGRKEDINAETSGRSGSPLSLDELTPPPPSDPEHWWTYLLDARLAEIGSVSTSGDQGSA